MLYGRSAERAVVDRLLADVGAGRSGALVFRGEAGIGKSAMLAYTEQAAAGMRTLRTTGVESEADIPFSSLESLIRPLLDRLDALPGVQATALRGVLGLAEPTGADRLLIGSAVLSLLATVADDNAVVCLVDDAHWVDTASREALLFAARRLRAEGIAIVLAARDERQFTADGIQELRLGGLEAAAAQDWLATHADALAAVDRARIVQESAGNPLALAELAAAVVADPMCVQYLDAYPLPVSRRIQELFSSRVRTLPKRTRRVLLLAAAGGGELATVLTAARDHQAGVADFAPAEEAGLISVDHDGMEFRHPLIRSAVYQGASLADRLAAHRGLAKAYDHDPDRQAWQLAVSVTEPEESIAAQLEAAAERAREKGGHAAVAAAYDRAASLTPDPVERARREALAACYAFQSGRRQRALQLADRAAPLLTNPYLETDLVQLRTRAVWNDDPRAALTIMTNATAQVFEQAPAAAAKLALDTLSRTWLLHDPPAIKAMADRLTAWSWPESGDVRRYVRAISGLADLANGRHDAGSTDLREYIDWILDPNSTATLFERMDDQLFVTSLGDLHRSWEAAQRTVHLCRSGGAVEMLPLALGQFATAQFLIGRHGDAHCNAAEAIELSQDLGQSGTSAHAKTVLAFLAAIAGDEQGVSANVEPALALDVPTTRATAGCASGLLDLGLGRTKAALDRLEQLATGPIRHARAVQHTLPNLVEAAASAGRPERGTVACERYVDWAEAAGQTWAKSTALRCRALLASTNEEAGKLFAEAVQLGQPDGSRFEHARTELLYGTWLRRNRRVLEARAVLWPALEAFERAGATPWAERARTELRAAGENPNPQRLAAAEVLDRLTPQELQVVRLAARGMSNRKIAAQLFLSPRTIEYHLYKAYPKLDIASRHELTQLELG